MNFSCKRRVGRPREFDEEAALEAAMDAFWRKGYEATSLADLCACTGLHKGSLYQAFGDKHQLFMRALEHYSNSHIQAVAGSAFTSDSPLENIRMVMRKMVDELEEGQGCLMINTLVELAPHDEEIRKALNKFGQQQLRLMTGLVEKAQQAGEIRSDEPADSIALRLMVMLAGIATTVKGFVPLEAAQGIVDDAIGALT